MVIGRVSLDISTAIAAWIALVLSLVATTASGFQLQHFIRFRRPKFTVRRAEFDVKWNGGIPFIGPGVVEIFARGARHPVTITKHQFQVLRGAGRASGGTAEEGPRVTQTLDSERHTPMVVRVDSGMSIETQMGSDETLPETLDCEVYLSNPEDVYIVPVPLSLAGDSSKYIDSDLGGFVKYLRRTSSRPSIRDRLPQPVKWMVRRLWK